jgi:hypothetical protein|eukprot:COSAG02_NODE_158_length_32954_cov_16.416771_24_plen_183_part_00
MWALQLLVLLPSGATVAADLIAPGDSMEMAGTELSAGCCERRLWHLRGMKPAARDSSAEDHTVFVLRARPRRTGSIIWRCVRSTARIVSGNLTTVFATSANIVAGGSGSGSGSEYAGYRRLSASSIACVATLPTCIVLLVFSKSIGCCGVVGRTESCTSIGCAFRAGSFRRFMISLAIDVAC